MRFVTTGLTLPNSLNFVSPRRKPLRTKVVRDIWRAKTLFITIVALLALGVGIFVTMFSAFLNVEMSENYVYEELKFPDAFFYVPNIPNKAVDWIEDLEGVVEVEGRYVQDMSIRKPGEPGESVAARLISLPDRGVTEINRLVIREGKFLRDGNGRFALVDKLFADYYGLQTGDDLNVNYQGVDRTFELAGTFTSSEYLWKTKGGAELITSPGDLAVLMVRRNAVDEFRGVEGLINDVTVLFAPDADHAVLIEEIDRFLDRYGAHDVVKKEDQISYAALKADLEGFGQMAIAVPILFLVITVLITYSMLSRTVQSQRTIIGLMRAEGFSSGQVLRHYMMFPLLIAIVGGGLGIGWGLWAAGAFTSLYVETLALPFTIVRGQEIVLVIAFVAALVTCLIAGLQPALAAARLMPSVAMHNGTSGNSGSIFLERFIPMRRISPVLRLTIRNMVRGRWRTVSSLTGILLSVAMVTAVMGMLDSINMAFNTQFEVVQKYDMKVLFTEPVHQQKVDAIEVWSQVRRAEPISEIGVKLINDDLSKHVLVTAIGADDVLVRPDYVAGARPFEEDGIYLSETIARELALEIGDIVFLEAEKLDAYFTVVGFIDHPITEEVYMPLSQARNLLRGQYATAGLITLEEPDFADSVEDRLELYPYVMSVERTDEMRKGFEELMELTYMFLGIMIIFGMSLAAFAVFNAITLNIMERDRELATMRTLGFSRWQVDGMLTV
jgi:putative ABC transport system permease protein